MSIKKLKEFHQQTHPAKAKAQQQRVLADLWEILENEEDEINDE
ncbi:hypothetical protein [Catenovulum sediminis]|nr:hypothetical protein [Catenovulum sediminis]